VGNGKGAENDDEQEHDEEQEQEPKRQRLENRGVEFDERRKPLQPNLRRTTMKPTFRLALLVASLAGMTELNATITITRQPTNQWVSLGAHVTNLVTVSSTAPPITYQWHGPSGQLLAGETNRSPVTLSLVLPSIQASQAGGYYAVLSDTNSGPVQSDTATITVDPTFIKITGGPLVTAVEPTEDSTWWDYDNDGLLDVVVPLVAPHGPGLLPSFYRQNPAGTFTKVTTNAVAQSRKRGSIAAVADCDNDGDLDIYMRSHGAQAGEPRDDLFRNDGSGRFTALANGPWTADADRTFDCTFVDIDRDGLLDVFVLNYDQPPCLYRQAVAGGFIKLTAAEVGALLDNPGQTWNGAWADYDNDGDLDLWTEEYQGNTRLLQNNGHGFFNLATPASFAQSPGGYGVWGDVDNDGFAHLFVGGDTASGARPNALYRNLAGQDFSDVAAAAGVAVRMRAFASTLGDYDNDGWLDIFAAYWYEGAADASRTNVLFHNRGDGTFESLDVGSPIRDGADQRLGARWVDYDNDGWLDLFLTCGTSSGTTQYPRLNHLFRNNGIGAGNTNHWLKIKLNGQTSNRSGIGAKIRVKATIAGKELWQVREMTGNGYSQTCPGLIAHFGLGDSVQATTVRIEWPSGIVQTLTNLPAGLTGEPPLVITEHQNYPTPNPPPHFNGATPSPAGCQLSISEPVAGFCYCLEATIDLATWTKLMARASAGGIYEWVDEQASNQPTRFYRLVVP
jgi:hypothetical protein